MKDGSSSQLVKFHSRHKYTFMAHNQSLLKKMGKLVAKSGDETWEELLKGNILIPKV